MSNQISGKAIIKVDGTVLAADEKATLNPGGISREPQSHNGQTYYTETSVAPELTMSVLLQPGVDVLALNEITGATILFEADTGQNYFMRNAFSMNVVEHSSEGKAEMKLSGDKAEPV